MENDKRELRRNQDKLVTIGMGVITFSIWSIIRFFTQAFLNKDEIISNFWETVGELPEDMMEYMSDAVILLIYFGIVSIFMLIEVAIEFYVGLSAKAEGMGKKKGILYLIISVILAILNLMSTITMLDFSKSSAEIHYKPLERVALALIDLTYFVVLVEMIFAAIKVKKLKRMIQEKMNGAPA